VEAWILESDLLVIKLNKTGLGYSPKQAGEEPRLIKEKKEFPHPK
jgi:hypothetical protein